VTSFYKRLFEMSRNFVKLNLSFALLIVALAAWSAFGQPNADQKKLEAQTAFDAAIKFRQENTFQSYKQSLEKFQAAAKLFAELGDQKNAGKSLLGIGLIEDLLGEPDAALQFYQKALEIFRAAGDKESEARALNNLGLLYDETGDRQKALEYHNQALPLRRLVRDESGEARTLNSIGAVYADLGERQKALEYLNKSLAIRRRINEFPEQAITLNNLGRVYDELGERQKALDNFNLSLALRRVAGDRGGAATTLNNIGMTLAGIDKPSEALEYYQKAVEIFSSIGFEKQKASVFNNIGEAYLQLGEYPKALEYNRRAIPLYKAVGDKSGEATALNNIGFANFQLGEPALALESYDQALVLAQSAQAKGLEAIILSNLMRCFQQLNNPAAAVFYGKQSVNKYQELRLAIKSLDKSTQRIYLKTIEDQYRFLADLLIGNGSFTEANQVLEMLKEEEYFEFVRRDSAEIKTLAQRVTLNEKEKLLLERYSKLAATAAGASEKFQKLDDKKRKLEQSGGTLAPEEKTEYARLSADLADANAAFKLFLEKQLAREIGGENARKIEIDRALQEKLRQFGGGTVAVSTVVTNDRYRVIVTTPNVQIDGKTEIKATLLNKKIFAFREALKDPTVETRILGKELYDILIKPIEKVLIEANAKTIVWSLDGTLRYIPLAALSPDGAGYLVEKYQTVILTPQTRDEIGDSSAEWKAVGMGVSTAQSVVYPDFPNDPVTLDALPAIEDELKTIIREPETEGEKGILPGKRFLNEGFTLKNLTDSLAKKNADGTKEFSVVHLASHFRLAKNWSDSFLLIGNGKILTLEAIGNSPEIDFADVDLVTLSACNTASSKDSNGGEVDSLAGLIQLKNGKSVLATLWEVEDESTALLMSSFYRQRRENPQITKAAAMQSAQKLLLYGGTAAPNRTVKPVSAKFSSDKTRPLAHPAYWSPFVLIGNWR
jgi:CHAT domain-containing protein/Flp pilus assembly protein TadD